MILWLLLTGLLVSLFGISGIFNIIMLACASLALVYFIDMMSLAILISFLGYTGIQVKNMLIGITNG